MFTYFTYSKIKVLPSITLFQTKNLADFSVFFCHGTSTVASLSRWAATFVYNMLTVIQSVSRSICGSWAFCSMSDRFCKR